MTEGGPSGRLSSYWTSRSVLPCERSLRCLSHPVSRPGNIGKLLWFCWFKTKTVSLGSSGLTQVIGGRGSQSERSLFDIWPLVERRYFQKTVLKDAPADCSGRTEETSLLCLHSSCQVWSQNQPKKPQQVVRS